MSNLRLRILHSADELLTHADAWNELWRRSEVALPILQAELLADWLRHFAGDKKFQAIAVEHAGQFVAALPLRSTRLKGLLPVAGLTTDPWSPAGDLLLDESCDVPEVLDLLVSEQAKSPEALLWFEGINAALPRWQAWQAAADRAEWTTSLQTICDVGVIEAGGGWEAYESDLSSDFRRNLRRRTRQLEEKGALSSRSWDDLQSLGAAVALRNAFEVEDRSWKGSEGTSVLRTAGMLEFFTRQAELLAARRQLALHQLELNGRIVAFEFGYQAKGVYFTHKVSFLPEFHRQAPSHTLRWKVLPSLFALPEFRQVDFCGKVTEAAERWLTRRYTLSRLVAAPRRIASRTLMAAYTKLWPRLRKLRRVAQAT